ncbi:MAG: hypothetical protein HOI66_22615 [Verrucomicrobia bacterium]|jgi:hypothetical protein|nr:hypothetical protein [Verrucomicrobiota bacterium]
MVDLVGELNLIVNTLEESGLEYALCGDIAVAIHGYPRATRDIDFIIKPEDLPAIRQAIKHIGFTIDGGVMSLKEGTDHEFRLWRVSRRAGAEIFTIDFILVRSWLLDIWEQRQQFVLSDRTLTAVNLEGLRKMKTVGARPQDVADLDRLNDPNSE